MPLTNEKEPIKFGTIIVDKLHMFMGHSDPSAFVVADMWSNEDDYLDGDGEVWTDHYRGHTKLSFAMLRDTARFEVVGQYDSSSKMSALEQCKFAAEKWSHDNREWVDARTNENQQLLKDKSKS